MTLSILFYFLIFLLIIGSAYYSIEQMISFLSLKKIQKHLSITEPLPKVSIVVFFRSSCFISSTIEQLLKQNYKASFDIWIVGKESKIIETHSKIQFLQINDTSSLNKIDILKTIASMAEGEIICSIDNEDVISSEWLNSIIREFEPGIEIVKAPVRYAFSKENWIQKSITFSKSFLDISNTAKIIQQKDLLIPTDNIAFLKSFLISNFKPVFNKPGRIQTTNNTHSILEKSLSQKSIPSIKQTINTAQKSTPFFIKAFFIYLSISVFFVFFSIELFFTILFTWFLKLYMDFLFIIRGMKISGTPISWKSFLLFELLQAPLITISSLLSLYRFLRMKKQGSLL